MRGAAGVALTALFALSLSLSVPDYASVNTYRNLVENKENIDWCSENYRTVHDRIRCMRTLTPGPLLA